ncbi:MAG: cytochrome c-type biogenesis protein CcmH [Gammaproteobacteria bacterium]|nr:cytochrome c-type biogenesis protein CcmH [Gammaproteobacteria bacterium]MDE0611443.1 cytochrome c-type biogenesis protein CcmH [Gammaproteobacteria bacterium]
MKRITAWGFCLFFIGGVCLAADEAGDERYQALLYELRCLVCQNQSLADSDAELAGDLRKRVRDLIDQGMTDKQIIEHLQARYGDFILYRPPFAWRTVALWIGPFVLLALTAWLLLRRIRRRHVRASGGLSDAERERLAKVLKRGDD